jgi:hypothetical protein
MHWLTLHEITLLLAKFTPFLYLLYLHTYNNTSNFLFIKFCVSLDFTSLAVAVYLFVCALPFFQVTWQCCQQLHYIVLNDGMTDEWWHGDSKVCGHGLTEALSQNLLAGTVENQTMVRVFTKIWTNKLPNMSLEHYGYTTLLGLFILVTLF